MRTRTSSQAGSTIVIALGFLGVLAIIGAVCFQVVQSRYRQVHQTAAFEEALLASEAGIDLAVNELRKGLYDPTNAWTGWSSSNSTASSSPSYDPTTNTSTSDYYNSKVLLRQGEGGQTSYAAISVDAPSTLYVPSTGDQWYRVRSLGVATISGGVVPAGDSLDLSLRRFDFIVDHRTRKPTLPKATRLVEAIVKPVGTFRLALLGVQSINMNNHNIVVDSYDSRDPNKSTNGLYDSAKRQQNGNIATDGTLIDAGSAQIYGSASTDGGTVLNATNVTGTISSDFYQDIFPVVAPSVLSDPSLTSTSISSKTTLNASAGSPASYNLTGISLSGNDTLTFAGASDGSATYVQIIVKGDITTSGNAQIILGTGVHLRIFVSGDVKLEGNGILNPGAPLNLQLYGLDRPTNADGSPQSPGEMKIAGNGGFAGTVYAPGYNVDMVGGGNTDSIYGSFVGWTVNMTGVQSVHYDEALGSGGLISDFKVISWFEDNLSRNTPVPQSAQ
jgi:hypothetical protein